MGSIKKYIVGMADILGFSEMVKKISLSELIEKYEAVIRYVNYSSARSAISTTKDEGGVSSREIQLFRMDHFIFSDTILIWKEINEEGGRDEVFFSFIWCVYLIMDYFVRNKIPLRFGIAIGDCIMDFDRKIFLGQPIVDAYRIEEAQEWIGIGFHTSCQEMIPFLTPSIIEYNIPMKKNMDVLNYTVNWCGNDNESYEIIQELRKKIESNPLVLIKYDNTLKFLDHVRSLAPQLESIKPPFVPTTTPPVDLTQPITTYLEEPVIVLYRGYMIYFPERKALVDLERIANVSLNERIFIVDHHVRDLNLQDLNISSIPNSMKFFSELISLDLSGNSIDMLPSVVEKLRRLETLNLSQNDLKEFPSSILALKSLRNLDLSNNKLRNLPDALCEMECLQWLNIKDNELITLPEGLSSRQKNKRIEVLLSRNDIEEETVQERGRKRVRWEDEETIRLLKELRTGSLKGRMLLYLSDRPQESKAIEILFDELEQAIMGFDETWLSEKMGVSESQALWIIKNLRIIGVIKLGSTGLNFVINDDY
jgi:hypothetical protein